MHLPVWSASSRLAYAVLDDTDSWCSSDAVRIGRYGKTRHFAHAMQFGRMRNVRHFFVPTLSSPNHKALELLQHCPLLQTLSLSCSVNLEAHMNALVKGLGCTRDLRQLKIWRDDFVSTNLLDAIKALPLEALYFGVEGLRANDAVAYGNALCSTINSCKATLVSLELNFFSNAPHELCSIVCKELALPNLRSLALEAGFLNSSQMRDLCCAMEKIPLLTGLLVSVPTVECASVLTSFFDASFRAIRAFGCSTPISLPSRAVVDLFVSLRRNTHLESVLHFQSRNLNALVESQLLEHGFVISVDVYEDFSKELDFSAILGRNNAQRSACRQACTTLLAARRKKTALQVFPKELVANITRYLWMTRNQIEWFATK